MNQVLSQVYSYLPLKAQIFCNKVKDSDIATRILRGAFWSITSSVLSRGLTLLASILVARMLGKTEYGEFGMIRSTVLMFSTFAGFGLGVTATKYIAEYRNTDKDKAGRIIGLSFLFAFASAGLIALITIIAAPFLAKKIINAPFLIVELRLAAFILLFSALNGAQSGILIGFEAFKKIAKLNLISGVLGFPLQICLTLLFGLKGAVMGLGLSYLVLWILYVFAVRSESQTLGIIIFFKDSWKEWPVLYQFSLPSLISGLVVSIVVWASNALLVNQVKGFDEMALFEAANQWRYILLFIPLSITQIILPVVASINNDNRKIQKVLNISYYLNISISVFFTLIVIMFSKIIMSAYGSEFTQGQIVLILLALNTILMTFCDIQGKILASIGKMWLDFGINLVWGSLLIVSVYIFFNFQLGAFGLALSYLCSYLIRAFFAFVIIKKQLKFKNELYQSN